jgi:hypothetical protein
MKKTFFALAGSCLLLAAVANSVFAQGNNNVIAFTNTKHFSNSLTEMYYELGLVDLTPASTTDESAIHSKALRDFNSRFNHAMEAKWFAIPSGYFTCFKVDGFNNRAFYDKKGRWQASLKMFGEDKLPKDIRKIVKSTYYDYAITIVEEVDVADSLVYIVHLDDGDTIKNLRVTQEGEMDILSDFKKG